VSAVIHACIHPRLSLNVDSFSNRSQILVFNKSVYSQDTQKTTGKIPNANLNAKD